MKINKKTIIIILIILFMIWLFSGEGEVEEVVSNAGDETYTLMIYMCGSNLESEGGYASSDIEEMLKSQLAKEVNLLIYTGGAQKWYDYGISNRTNQIYKIESGNLELVKDNIGKESMAKSETLTYFLNFCKENYPANKYGLILWDHGGGAVSGFGYDENISDKNDTLTIDELKMSLDSFGTKLDFIGFDACLMANVETAYAVRNNADYFIASEETEPGSGWAYKKVLNQLSKNTSQNGAELAPQIIDTFIASNNGMFGADATLSCIDLSKMDNVYEKLVTFMNDIKVSKLDLNNFSNVSKAIKRTKAYADGEIDTIDLVNFSENINISASNDLSEAVKSAVIYNKTTDYVENSNGLSIYIPNKDLSFYQRMIKIYQNIGMTNEYISVLSQYANMSAGGRSDTYIVNNHEYEVDIPNYEEYDWYDENIASANENYYIEMNINVQKLEVIDKDDYYALHLSDKEWENIVSIESVLWYDDGEGYIDLGVDSYFEKDNDDDLKVTSDGKWVAINGQIVKYELVEHTDNYEKGKVPALLNGNRVNIIIYWDKDHPDGEVIGAEYADYYGDTTMYGRGLIDIKKGDEIDFIVDYYKYNGDYDDEYIYGDTLKVGKKGLKVSYEWIGDGECTIYYMLTDIYNNIYYTEPVIVY